VFKDRAVRKIFGLKREEVIETGENYIMKSFIISAPHLILFG
jgi:hypothetical protein